MSAELWLFLPLGYAISVALEIPVLLLGLSPRHAWGEKLLAGFWLTACTYPIVVLVLPLTVEAAWGRTAYLVVAETFAPLAECLLFYFAFERRASQATPVTAADVVRDFAAIIAANLASFLVGGWLLDLALRPSELVVQLGISA
jgi:hypothetical protein